MVTLTCLVPSHSWQVSLPSPSHCAQFHCSSTLALLPSSGAPLQASQSTLPLESHTSQVSDDSTEPVPLQQVH